MSRPTLGFSAMQTIMLFYFACKVTKSRGQNKRNTLFFPNDRKDLLLSESETEADLKVGAEGMLFEVSVYVAVVVDVPTGTGLAIEGEVGDDGILKADGTGERPLQVVAVCFYRNTFCGLLRFDVDVGLTASIGIET